MSNFISTKNDIVKRDITAIIPDFPFHYEKFLQQAKQYKQPLANIPDTSKGKTVAIIGGGLSGLISAYELMRIGLKPIVFECGGYIGGRLSTKLLFGKTPVEMGGMRFPLSSKGLFYYFNKVGMCKNMAPFPNPASLDGMGTMINYLGESDYFEQNSLDFPIPDKYKLLLNKWNKLLNSPPFYYDSFIQMMTEGNIDKLAIKELWNTLLKNPETGKSYDKLSFYEVLVEAGWDFDTIELFGQVGFGSGGWNTDYVNSFLEVLRVAYMALDNEHQVFYDGSQKLVERLFYKSPKDLGDLVSNGVDENKRVYDYTKEGFKKIFGREVNDQELLHTEVHTIYKRDYSITIEGQLHSCSQPFSYTTQAVIYTPQVRVLQMLMGKIKDNKKYQLMNQLLDASTWEAINYTHYMQSSKIFVQAKYPFWKERDKKGRYKMSTTLSDRLTRSTYLIDYTPINKGACICLSYTWNDDSLKFNPFNKEERYAQVKGVLADLYPEIDLENLVNSEHIEVKSWESDPYFLGAFKNNLPGQYKYQKRLFCQFADGLNSGNMDRFILAGDDVSFTAGWAEGAVSTAINAVDKVVNIFGGKTFTNNPGPIHEYENLKPIDI